MFKNAKVGDRVYDYFFQEWGTIKEINTKSVYPILVIFNDNVEEDYKYEGKRYDYVAQTLFWDVPKPIIPPKKPLPKLEVDTKILVWEYNEKAKQKRYFSHFNNDGKICCFISGKTSWTVENGREDTTKWEHWKLWKE